MKRKATRLPAPGLTVRKTPCRTCIYRADSPLDIEVLEAEVRNPRYGFDGFRQCHHHPELTVCCQGFWTRHKREFTAGQLAVRLDCVFTIADDGRIEHAPQPAGDVRLDIRRVQAKPEGRTGPAAPEPTPSSGSTAT